MFAWLAKMLGWPSKDELDGISLEENSFWEVSPPKDIAGFVRQLGQLLPEGSVIHIEGTCIARDVVRFLENRQLANPTRVARGTIGPKPRVFQLLATPENLEGLAALFDRYAAPEIGDHFHVYAGTKVYLEWYDAFFDDPLLLSKDLPVNDVQHFADALGCRFKLSGATNDTPYKSTNF